MTNKNAPFPQADDFNKVLSILNIDDETKLQDFDYLSAYLGDITGRQVQYYLSACEYLDLVSKRKFTETGAELRKAGINKQIALLAKQLFSDETFGEVYFLQQSFGFRLEKDEVVEIMKKYVFFDSEPMYQRRSSTVMSWVDWFTKYFDKDLEKETN